MQSVFTNKAQQPTSDELQTALAETFAYWLELAAFTKKAYPKASGGWHYASEKYGWSFRINDSKRALIYLLPRAGFFKVAMVFGQKATDQIMQSTIADSIKTELQNATPYAEGRGIRIEVNNAAVVEDIKLLVQVKLGN